MEYQIKRDSTGRIIEVDGINTREFEPTIQSFMNGMQEVILTARNTRNGYDPSEAKGVLNTMVAELGREIMDVFIERVEAQYCEAAKHLVASSEDTVAETVEAIDG